MIIRVGNFVINSKDLIDEDGNAIPMFVSFDHDEFEAIQSMNEEDCPNRRFAILSANMTEEERLEWIHHDTVSYGREYFQSLAKLKE